MTTRQIDKKNSTYYFYDLINIKNFDPSMLKLQSFS